LGLRAGIAFEAGPRAGAAAGLVRTWIPKRRSKHVPAMMAAKQARADLEQRSWRNGEEEEEASAALP
jgi:hypothetical protein